MVRHPKILIGWLAIGVFGISFAVFLAGHHTPIKAQALFASESGKLSLKEPLVISFNFPVNRRALNPIVSPEIEGMWTWEDDIGGHLARTAIFTPETVWEPNQVYTVALESLGPFLAVQPTTKVEIIAETLPLSTIIDASISEGANDVPSVPVIHLFLNQPLSDDVDFSFRTEPEVTLSIQEDPTNKSYVISSEQQLVAGQTYRLFAEREVVYRVKSSGVVERRSPREIIFERLFTIKTPPSIAAVSPTGESVAPTSRRIELKFSAVMNRTTIDQAISVEPPIAGSWQWLDDSSLVFEAAGDLSLDTLYKIAIGEGGLDQSGDRLAPIQIAFRTAGTLRVVSATPHKRSGVGLKEPIRLTFDQLPNEQSVAEHFTVSPATDLQFSRSGNVIVVTPVSGWAYNTTYNATLRSGAVGQYGRPNSSETLLRFTSEEKVVLLNIAWDRQDRALSCEAAALKMALAGKGVRVSEDDIMTLIGYDPTPRTSGGWGDPDVAFVGDINGSQNTTGYGVHWGPIAAAANAWRPARAVSGISLSDAARELEAGNPIVIWGVQGRAYYDPWITPAGRKIEAWKGEHARTLIGFRGSVENPTSFIINDPIAGRITWSASRFRQDWAIFGNSGVIVY